MTILRQFAGRDYQAEAEAAWPTLGITECHRANFIDNYCIIARSIDIQTRPEAAAAEIRRRMDAKRRVA